jgi:glycosyltransferase involved in cell wall biosynthesis
MLILETWLRAHPGRRAESTPLPLEIAAAAAPPRDHETITLWNWLRARGQPVLVFSDGDLSRLAWHLPPGSAVVAAEPCAVPEGVKLLTMSWRHGNRTPEVDALLALPAGVAVFPGNLAGVHRAVLERLEQERRPFVHRFDGRWCHGEVTEALVASLLPRRAPRRLGLFERTRSVRLPVQQARHVEGHCYGVQVPELAQAAAAGQQVVLYEDGVELQRGSCSAEAISAHGRGRHKMTGAELLFSSSDNSAPASNQRRYEVLCRNGNGAHGRGLLAPLERLPGAWLPLSVGAMVHRLLQRGAPDERRLLPPFVHDGGHCYRVPVRRMLIRWSRLQQGFRLVLCEDGVPLPSADAAHDEIRHKGGGRYSVWDRWVFFAATDGSDPNRNGRVYTAQLVPPADAVAARALASGQGQLVQGPMASADFASALAARIASETALETPQLRPGARVALLVGALGAGGTERQLSNLALELDRRGFAATILCLAGLHGDGAHYRRLLAGSRELRVLAADRVHPDFAPEALAADPQGLELLAALPDEIRDDVFRLCSHLQQIRPEVLHCSLDPTNIAGGTAALLTGVPRVVLGVRSVNPSHFAHIFRPHFADYYRLLAKSRRVRLCANSHAGARDYAHWLGVPAAAFTVIHNGLDAASLREPDDAATATFRRELGIAADAPVLAGVLRFSAEKRPLLFLEVAARLRELVPGARVLLAGSGPMEAEVTAAIRRHGLDETVVALGRRHDVPLVMRAADALLLVSVQEGLPNVLLEAQYFGRPVVATRVGGCAECIREGDTGLLCDPDDVEGLAAACAGLLADRERARAMGHGGREFVTAHFSLSQMVEATLQVYR